MGIGTISNVPGRAYSKTSSGNYNKVPGKELFPCSNT